jgi:phage terminase Nu1 subunit (DNA packaging protein)
MRPDGSYSDGQVIAAYIEFLKKSHKGVQSSRWSLEKASSEFGTDRKTITKRIRQNGIQPAEDGTFSTKQICAAIFGDIHGERLRKTRAEADKIEMDNERERGLVIDVGDVDSMWEVNDLNLKEKFIRIPEVFESRYHVGMEAPECRGILDALVDEVCQEISKSRRR